MKKSPPQDNPLNHTKRRGLAPALFNKMEMNFIIRKITPADNAAIEKLIRDCLIEFGANHDGTAWADPGLCRLSEEYKNDGTAYWVAVGESGELLGGTGIGKISGEDKICELQKMYCKKEARGKGVAGALLCEALEFASHRYDACYLETLENMTAAQRFYEKNGFKRTYPIGNTGHFCCDVRYLLRF